MRYPSPSVRVWVIRKGATPRQFTIFIDFSTRLLGQTAAHSLPHGPWRGIKDIRTSQFRNILAHRMLRSETSLEKHEILTFFHAFCLGPRQPCLFFLRPCTRKDTRSTTDVRTCKSSSIVSGPQLRKAIVISVKILEAHPPRLTRMEVKSLTETWRKAELLERVLQVAPGCMHVLRHRRVWRLDVTAETLEPLEEVKETTPLHPVFVVDMFMAISHEITRRQFAVAKCEQQFVLLSVCLFMGHCIHSHRGTIGLACEFWLLALVIGFVMVSVAHHRRVHRIDKRPSSCWLCHERSRRRRG